MQYFGFGLEQKTEWLWVANIWVNHFRGIYLWLWVTVTLSEDMTVSHFINVSTHQFIYIYGMMHVHEAEKMAMRQWKKGRGGGGESEIEQTTIYYIKQISVWTSNIINISCILATVLTVVEPRKPYPKFFCFTWNTQNKYILAWEQRKLSLYSFLFSLNHINY